MIHTSSLLIIAAFMSVLAANGFRGFGEFSGNGPQPPSNGPTAVINCDYVINPPNANFPSNEGFSSVMVNTQAGCSWTAVSNNPWITISGGSLGTGPGEVRYRFDANPNQAARSGTITIANKVFVITQAALVCSYSLSTSSVSHGPGEESRSVTVSAPTGCAWTSVSNSSWITVLSGSSGNGFATVTYNVAANPNSTARSGLIRIAGKDLLISQGALAATTCSISADPPPLVHFAPSVALSNIRFACSDSGFGSAGGGEFLVTLNTTFGNSVPKLTLETGSGTLTTSGMQKSLNTYSFAVPSYQKPLRSGVISLLSSDPSRLLGASSGVTAVLAIVSLVSPSPFPLVNPEATVAVLRPACTSFSVSPATLAIGAGGGSGSIQVVGSPDGCTHKAWTPSSDQGWLAVSGSGYGSGAFNWTAGANLSFTSRTATISVTTPLKLTFVKGTTTLTTTVTLKIPVSQAGLPPK